MICHLVDKYCLADMSQQQIIPQQILAQQTFDEIQSIVNKKALSHQSVDSIPRQLIPAVFGYQFRLIVATVPERRKSLTRRNVVIDRHDEIDAFVHSPHQSLKAILRYRIVAVQEIDISTLRKFYTGIACSRKSAVLGVNYNPPILQLVFLYVFLSKTDTSIITSVVNKQDFIVRVGLASYRIQTSDYEIFYIIYRNNNRNIHHFEFLF